MTAFSDEQRAELRASFEKSRLEYDADKAARRAMLHLAPPARYPSALDITADIAEMLTALENAVADLDNDAISADLYIVRTRLTKVGVQLAHLKKGAA